MSELLKQSINELEARAKRFDSAAAQLRQAAQNLRDLTNLDGLASPAIQSAKKPSKKKSAAKAQKPSVIKKTKTNGMAKSKGKPTLASAIIHVLEARHRQKSGGVKASQLYDEIQQGGFKFSGTNHKNNMTYLYKILRQQQARIKHSPDGLFALA